MGRSYQAPSLLYRYGPNSNLFANIVDEVACQEAQQQEGKGDEKAADNIAKYCSSQNISTTVTSNKDLGAEFTDTARVGFMLNPGRQFHVSFDGWFLERNDYIEPVLSDGTKLEWAGGLAQNQNNIQLTRRFNGLTEVTDLLRVKTTIANLHRNTISGWDASGTYQTPLFKGTLQLSDRITYTLWNRVQPFVQLQVEDRVGLYNYPRWKNNLSLSWFVDTFAVNLLLRSYAGYKQENKKANPLPSYSELDLTIDWKILRNSSINFGGKNILSTQPPLQDSTVHRHNSQLHGLRGPRFFVSYKQIF